MTTRVLLFDFGGTLDAEGIPWKDRFQRLAREEGLEMPQAEFDRAFYGATDTLEGTIPASSGLRDTVQRVSDGLAVRLGRDQSLLQRIGDRFAADSLAQLSASAAVLSKLRDDGSYRIGIVSNFYGNLRAVCDEAGLSPLVGVAVDSTVVGCKKPDPRIFQAALDALDATVSDAVFVGDSQKRDMAGARGMGMRHVWLRPADAPGNGTAGSGNGGACCREIP